MTTKNMTTIRIIFISAFLHLNLTGLTQTPADTLKVLFVGNSYSILGNIPHLISAISDSTKTKLLTSKSATSGARLSDHWNGLRGLKTKQEIKEGNFDIVVLQEQSMGPIEQPDSFLKYAENFASFIRENNAQPYFFVTWPKEKIPQQLPVIREMYVQAANKNNAGLVPVGDAWELAKSKRPDLDLYLDGSHPSSVGALLTACVFVGSLTGEIPKSILPWVIIQDEFDEDVILMLEDPGDISFCLKIAEEILER